MRYLRSSKCFKTTVELTFTTQNANACSPWTACSVFDWKYIFWVNLVKKLKIISLSWNFVPRLIQKCRIPWGCSLFLFSTGNTSLGKFDPKIQNGQFELKFRTRLMWIGNYAENMWCSLFLFLNRNTLFVQIWSKKNKFTQKFGTKTNLNTRNSMMFTFSVFDRKYFSVNLVQKTKIVSLSWKLVLRLIRIWRIQLWCSFFFYLRNLLQKSICWSWNLESRLIWICRIRW